MARGAEGGSTGSLDIAGTVTAVPCIVSAGKTRRWIPGFAPETTGNRLAYLVVARGSATDCSKVGAANLGQQAA